MRVFFAAVGLGVGLALAGPGLAGNLKPVPASWIFRAYARNPVRADQTYEQARVRVAGQVESIAQDLFGEGYVVMHRPDTGIGGVTASFREEAQIAKLVPGQTLEVTCMVPGGAPMGLVTLNDCVREDETLAIHRNGDGLDDPCPQHVVGLINEVDPVMRKLAEPTGDLPTLKRSGREAVEKLRSFTDDSCMKRDKWQSHVDGLRTLARNIERCFDAKTSVEAAKACILTGK